jgi:hypothetical protein
MTAGRCRAIVLVALAVCAQVRLWAAEEPKKREPFVYDAKGHRDPFIALVRDGKLIGTQKGAPLDTSKPVLYGILWDPHGQSMAMLNDTEVKVGDTVGIYQVLEIRKDAVVLSAGGDPVVLQIEFETPPKSPQEPKGR